MNRRGSFTFGILLILVGGWFLAVQMIPQLDEWVMNFAEWPAWIIAPGVLFLAAAIISGVSGLAVPGAILSGLGGIFYYTSTTGDWQSMSYLWALIIASIGVGVFLMHLLDGNPAKAINEGGSTILTGVVMFLILGSFLRAMAFDQEPFFGDYWPLMLIAAGLWSLIRPMFRRGGKGRVVAVTPSGEEVLEELTPEEISGEEEGTGG